MGGGGGGLRGFSKLWRPLEKSWLRELKKKKEKDKTVIKNVTVSSKGMMAYAVAVAVAAQTGWLYVILEHFYIAAELLYSLRVYF